jgi:hypothetical protein
MSEFKFACPVCGQHMVCDSSQAGSVMECPTCFQKITAPQATVSDEHKFILTGSKFVEKKITAQGSPAAPPKPDPGNKFLVAAVVVILVLAGAAVFTFRGKHLRPKPGLAWPARDIGAVGAAGSSSQAGGVFTISGSGADIWHRDDGFQFVFQPLNGDGALTAQVLNILDTDEWAKAGVMIRETTNASSKFVLACIRSDGQAQFIWRDATGAEAQASALVGGKGCPKWLKIVRSGNSFGAHYKVNAGDEWKQLGTAQPISMAPKTWIGLIVCAHRNGVLCQAQFDEVTLQTDNKAGRK